MVNSLPKQSPTEYRFDHNENVLGRQTAHELVREYLRKAVLSGAIASGTRLIQADIAAHLGVSTTPVREAIRDLVTEGLVDFVSHQGAVVHSPDLDEVAEMYEARQVVEPLILRSAFRRDAPAMIEAATRIQEQLDSTKDARAWAQLNNSFHAALVHTATRRLLLIAKVLQDVELYVANDVIVEIQRVTERNADHHRILKALRSGDIDRAARVLETHLAGTVQRTVRQLRSGAGDVGHWPGQVETSAP